MLLKQAKQNSMEMLAFTFLIAIGMSIAMFTGQTIQYMHTPENGTPLFNTIYQFFFDSHISAWTQITSLILLAIEILLTIILNSDFELTRAKWPVFMLIYSSIALSYIPNCTLLPEQLASIFTISGIINIMACHNIDKPTFRFFDASLFFGIATILCITAVITLPLAIAALIFFRMVRLREISAVLLGYITPIIFYLAIYYITEGTIAPISEYLSEKFNNLHRPIITYNSLICIAIVIPMLTTASILLIREYNKYNLFCSRSYRLMFTMFITTTITAALPWFGPQAMRLSLMPISLLYVTVFNEQKYGRWHDIYFILFIVVNITMQWLWYRL